MNEIRGEYADNRLILHMGGRIDSNNASAVEQEVNTLLESRKSGNIVIDAKALDYISSAGLRVLLRIRKTNSALKIINAKMEVYEILDMTGFTQMIKVEKAYREVSIEGCEVIGQGANGTLYRIDKDNVVKVYNNADALSEIQHEREMAKIALVLGIPTAISYDVVKVAGSYGSVFELLNAKSFAHILINEPEKTDWCVKEFTDMMSRIHGTLVPHGKLPDIRETALGWVEFLKDYLPEEYYIKARRLVREVPKDDHMIHGDYHIKNLELQDDEVLLIDMDTLAVGHPIFELASMYNAFIGFSEYDHGNVGRFLGLDFERSSDFFHKVLARYLGTEDPEKLQEVEDKARIVGYIRMIRRSIRRKGLEDEERHAEIDLWKSRLIELLDRVDTLLFTRNEIDIEAQEEKLNDVLEFVNGHLDMAGCDPKTKMQIDISVEELFVNVAKYAYEPNTGRVKIRTEVKGNPRFCEITFIDSGIPFNPLEQADPDTSLSAEERAIGGLGIFMVKKNSDQVEYEYKDGQNILTIRRFF